MLHHKDKIKGYTNPDNDLQDSFDGFGDYVPLEEGETPAIITGYYELGRHYNANFKKFEELFTLEFTLLDTATHEPYKNKEGDVVLRTIMSNPLNLSLSNNSRCQKIINSIDAHASNYGELLDTPVMIDITQTEGKKRKGQDKAPIYNNTSLADMRLPSSLEEKAMDDFIEGAMDEAGEDCFNYVFFMWNAPTEAILEGWELCKNKAVPYLTGGMGKAILEAEDFGGSDVEQVFLDAGIDTDPKQFDREEEEEEDTSEEIDEKPEKKTKKKAKSTKGSRTRKSRSPKEEPVEESEDEAEEEEEDDVPFETEDDTVAEDEEEEDSGRKRPNRGGRTSRRSGKAGTGRRMGGRAK